MHTARALLPPPGPLPPDLENLMLAAALDPDFTVRETALRDLHDRRHPALPALVTAQLNEPDPQLRLPGLQLFKTHPPDIGLRPLAVYETLLAEAAQPLPPPSAPP